MTFSCLETSSFVAFIADNSANGIHRSGYNGLSSLIPRHTGNNLFVPAYAGLNYETISLAGLEPYRHEHGSKFEPRSEPMFIESADEESVVLVQPETSHSHVSARITFTVEEPHYIHQKIELTFHRRFCPDEEPNQFRSLWASYMHGPPDRHIYSKPDLETGADLVHWYGITKTDHGSPEMQVKLMPQEEISAAGHLAAMAETPLLTDDELTALAQPEWGPMALPKSLDGMLSFYYGLCHDQMVLMMFKQPERFRLAYSPCGGGTQPEWNPAWDYVLALEDAPLEETCTWDLCLVTKPYMGRADVLREVRRYVTT
ncbi:MAG: hypothetical protein QF437_04445 [Planctomycetota bacterium]|jgi:hypothetical protein|nr:hypothetical protein [Planctomycetota bacterium]MDP7129711.1 hypothetical protein [Planctomycetota bacterium]MDP7250195.1 hypothetical protein [Planctomycetota bacterium]